MSLYSCEYVNSLKYASLVGFSISEPYIFTSLSLRVKRFIDITQCYPEGPGSGSSSVSLIRVNPLMRPRVKVNIQFYR